MDFVNNAAFAFGMVNKITPERQILDIRDKLDKTLDGLEGRVAKILRLHERDVSNIYSTHYNMMKKEIKDLQSQLKTKLEERPEHGMDQEALIINLRNIIKKMDDENAAGHKLITHQAELSSTGRVTKRRFTSYESSGPQDL
jgi:hypothetical protein